MIELTRNATFWQETPRAAIGSGPGEEGGGGSRVHLLQLGAPPPPPPPVPHVTPPVQVPKTIPPPVPPAPEPVPVPAAPVTDTVVRVGGDTTSGSGGSGGGTGGGTGPGTGRGGGQPSGGTAPDSSRTGARPPEPRQLILPPFDYPRSMRGVSIDVNFFVLADGRVDHVVFVPEIPDRAYAKKLDDAMRAYRFRPARSADGQAVPGVAVVRVSF